MHICVTLGASAKNDVSDVSSPCRLAIHHKLFFLFYLNCKKVFLVIQVGVTLGASAKNDVSDVSSPCRLAKLVMNCTVF